ncbi:MAG: DNA primase [Waddliaceae bacterium]
MPLFTRDSLESLRGKVDLVDLLSSHIDLKPSGSTYKGLCPFHDEKSPSFMIQRGDSHYHCFGCGAHGDAIQFLMNHLHLSFQEAVESLAERFQVHLETIDTVQEAKGPSPRKLKEALSVACGFYHFCLMETEEGEEALRYLEKRGMGRTFCEAFQVGFAPSGSFYLKEIMSKKGIHEEILFSCGLLKQSSQREFFSERIMFPIHDALGSVIGFSGRKIREETFGGKYINTPETPVFKKSRVLFGLNHCRKEIAKEKKAIIVEGQIDALKLIEAGFKTVVAGQGTAFGKEHVKELEKLGVTFVQLALDGDSAGMDAAAKIGHLFLQNGIEVHVVPISEGKDPDAILNEGGVETFSELLEKSVDYLTWLFDWKVRSCDMTSPAQKQQLVKKFVNLIRTFQDNVLIHESLKKLSLLANIPSHLLGVEETTSYFRSQASAIGQKVATERILEEDLLRLLLFSGRKNFVAVAKKNLNPEGLTHPICQRVYELICSGKDLLSLIEDPEIQEFIEGLEKKRVDLKNAGSYFSATLEKILIHNWIQKRDEINRQIHLDPENLDLLKQYSTLSRNPPKIIDE